MTTARCDSCYGDYDEDTEGADGVCPECFDDPYEDDEDTSP